MCHTSYSNLHVIPMFTNIWRSALFRHGSKVTHENRSLPWKRMLLWYQAITEKKICMSRFRIKTALKPEVKCTVLVLVWPSPDSFLPTVVPQTQGLLGSVMVQGAGQLFSGKACRVWERSWAFSLPEAFPSLIQFYIVYNKYEEEVKNIQSDQGFCRFQELYIMPFPSISSPFTAFLLGCSDLHLWRSWNSEDFFRFGILFKWNAKFTVVENWHNPFYQKNEHN